MMRKQLFCEAIIKLKEADKLQKSVHELIKNSREYIESDFMNGASLMINHEQLVADLLTEAMNDSCGMISWWIYDCEYGTDHAELYDSEGNVCNDLSKAEDLYDYIVGVAKQNG